MRSNSLDELTCAGELHRRIGDKAVRTSHAHSLLVLTTIFRSLSEKPILQGGARCSLATAVTTGAATAASRRKT